MTIAICIKCGARKVGAFTSCLKCGFDPESPEDQAKALMLSDHNLSPDQLEEWIRQIQAGEMLQFDAEAVRKLSESIVSNPDAMTLPLGCLIIPWALIALTMLLALMFGVVLLFPNWVTF